MHMVLCQVQSNIDVYNVTQQLQASGLRQYTERGNCQIGAGCVNSRNKIPSECEARGSHKTVNLSKAKKKEGFLASSHKYI